MNMMSSYYYHQKLICIVFIGISLISFMQPYSQKIETNGFIRMKMKYDVTGNGSICS